MSILELFIFIQCIKYMYDGLKQGILSKENPSDKMNMETCMVLSNDSIPECPKTLLCMNGSEVIYYERKP